MSDVLCFVYINTKNEIKAQAITNVSENDEYFQGESLLPDEDGKLKTFRKDRVIEYVADIDIALKYIIDGIDSGEFKIREPKPETFDVHFTGFKKDDKAILEKLASDAKMEVRKSVTKSLKLLCYGYNASQMKMDKARAMGVIILNENKFREFLETGDFTDHR